MENLNIGVIGLKGLPAFGGAATVGENIIAQLKHKHQFTVYAVSSHASKNVSPDGYRQIVFNQFFIKKLNIFFYYVMSAFHAIFKSNYDLIHLHHTDGAFVLPLLCLKYRVICTSHAQPQVNEKWPKYVKFFFSINEKIAFKRASALTTVSMPLKRIYSKKTKREIHYIPNGINLNQAIDGGDIELPTKYLLFAAGRIIPLKGLHILIEALKMDHSKQELLVIGDLKQVPSYFEKIKSLSQGMNVSFLPIIKNKARLLGYVKYAEYFIFPSYSENMSIMLLEVAYTRTPLICSDIEANTAIFDATEVLFFKTNDPWDLADKIKFASENPTVMKKKAEKAFSKLEHQYNWDSISIQYNQLYLDLAQK